MTALEIKLMAQCIVESAAEYPAAYWDHYVADTRQKLLANGIDEATVCEVMRLVRHELTLGP